MAIDSSGSVPGPVGLTVPPPTEELPAAEARAETEPASTPEPAPLPAYQGSVIDESV